MLATTQTVKGFTTPLAETAPSTPSKCAISNLPDRTKIKDLATQSSILYIMLSSEMHAHSGFERISVLEMADTSFELWTAEDNFFSNPTAENKAEMDRYRLELLYLSHIDRLQRKSVDSGFYGQTQSQTSTIK